MTHLRARLYSFAFITTHTSLWGMAYGRWLRLGLSGAILVSLILLRWQAAVLFVILRIITGQIYRRAQKNGYATFIPSVSTDNPPSEPLYPEEQLNMRVTGKVSSGRTEFEVLLRQGKVWRTALHEYVLMVERGGDSYLYQFIQPDHIDEVASGQFLFGDNRYQAVKIVYHTDWSPDLDDTGLAYYVGGGALEKRLKRTIYLTFDFEDETAEARLRQSLLISRDRDGR